MYYYLFNRSDKLSHGKNLLLIPPKAQDKIAGATNSVEGFLADFPAPILLKISG